VFARGANKDETIMYNYIGGGVSYQPKHTFSLVYKSLPRVQARRLYALWHYILGVPLSEALFVRKQNTRAQEQLTLHDKHESVLEEKELVRKDLSFLRRKREQTKSCFSPRPDPTTINIDAHDL